MPLPNIIKLFQKIIKKLLSAKEFNLEIRSGEIIKNRTEQELSFLYGTLLLDLLYVSTVHYQKIISNSMGVMACTIFRLHGR